MLTIDNIEKIKQYSYDVQWTCDKIQVTDTQYEFFVDKRNIAGQICDYARITLHREPSITDYRGGNAYPISLNMKPTKYIVTADYIKNINNLVNTFTEILGNQYKPI
jgi:hypothetical protein